MNIPHLNSILNRQQQENTFRDFLRTFDSNPKQFMYVYGESGSGKTRFVHDLLKDMHFDGIVYDSSDMRSTITIDEIMSQMSNTNVTSMWTNCPKRIAIVMDELDGMNNGDKGGITTITKIMRQNKKKRSILCPIIYINNYKTDKKNKELIKYCKTIELLHPTNAQIIQLIYELFQFTDKSLIDGIVRFVQCDLNKLNSLYTIYLNSHLNIDIIKSLSQNKILAVDTSQITSHLFLNRHTLSSHAATIPDPERTNVGLLWHENLIDIIHHVDQSISIPFYMEQLKNIRFTDYVDRNIFQKQLWNLSELTSIIKTFLNHSLFHTFIQSNHISIKPKDCTNIRFTKVRTKYANEHNNFCFVQQMCQLFSVDKKDLFHIVLENRLNPQFIVQQKQIHDTMRAQDYTQTDILRIQKYVSFITIPDAPEVDIDDDI